MSCLSRGGGPPEDLPDNLVLWPALCGRGRGFYIKQLLHPDGLRRLFAVLWQCQRAVGLTPVRIRNCVIAACIRSAFERNKRFRRFLGSSEPVIVYAYWGAFPALCLPLAKKTGALTVVRYHNVDLYLEREENDGFIPWRDEVQASADLHAPISEHGRDYFEALARDDVRGRRMVARLGSPDVGPPRRPSDVVRGLIVLVSVSHIVPVKRTHLILRLAKELARHRAVEWHHFGAGRDPRMDMELQRTGPETLTVKMWGATPWADIQAFYRDNDVTCFVNLSEFEGIPVAVMEAMNAGVPVVASDVCGTSEAVITGRSGLLVSASDCEDSAKLASTVLSALEPGGAIARSDPRAVWEELYSAEANSREFVSVLCKLADA